MKLILYRRNLEKDYIPNHIVALSDFPKHITDMARFAKVVEFQDREYTKILKDRNKSWEDICEQNRQTDLQASLKKIKEMHINRLYYQGYTDFRDFLNKRYPNCEFSKVYTEEDGYGIKKIVLER